VQRIRPGVAGRDGTGAGVVRDDVRILGRILGRGR
jgi:hypothetical protein